MALELLFPHFDELIRTPEDVQRLNEAILQLAVQGKLVAQDPNDEPASELLKRIKEEKAKYLTREHDNDYEDSISNVRNPRPLFRLPDGWTWVCIGDVCFVRGGKRLPKGSYLIESPTDHIYIRVTDMKNGSIEDSDLRYVSDDVYEVIKQYTISKNDLYITIAGTIGKVGIVPPKFDGMNLTENAARLRFVLVNRLFARYVLNSRFAQTQFADRVNQMAQPKLALIRIKTALMPLPPLSEQDRIVAKVDELFAQTRALEARLRQAQEDVVTVNRAALHRLHTAQDDDQFQAAWRTLRDHFDVLYDDPRNVAELRQTILDLAVRGKLVPQDPSDEPAEELLRRTNVSTVRTSGATKARQVPTVLPNIPAGWTLVSSSAVCLSINDGDHLPPPKSETGIPFLVISNIRMGKLDFRNTRFVPQEYYDTLRDERKPRQGDVLYSIVGSLGTAVLIEDAVQFCFQRHMALLRPSAAIESKYLFYLLQAPVMLQQARATATGTAQLTIPMSGLRSLVFPLPPLVEQQRIVAKVDQLMRLCDELEAGLARTETQRRNLTAAVLQTG